MHRKSSHPSGRHVSLVIWCALAGAASSSLSLLFGDPGATIRGAILGLSLALGIVGLNLASGRQLSTGRPPGWLGAAVAGLVSGLLAGTALVLLLWWSPSLVQHVGEIRLPDSPGRHQALVLSLGYGLALHLAYGCRWRFRSRRGAGTLFVLLAAGFLVGALRGLLLEGLDPAVMALVGAFAGLPFAALWGWAVLRFDPAWTVERWRSGEKGSRAETSSAVARTRSS